MGRILLVGRLAVRDLQRRRIEAALLLAIMAATTTLTLGLVLHEAASDPYQSTREATNGPDVVASVSQPAERSGLEALASAPGVIDHSGPYPVTPAELQASGRTSDVQAVGRDAAPASVDQPELIQGSWVSDGGVVVEAAFANALDVRVGDPVTLDGRSFEVVGVAVTAAMPTYPGASCIVPPGCASGATPEELSDLPPGLLQNPGLVWLTQADVRSLTPDPDSLSYVMNLKLADPDEAQAFVDANLPESLDAPRLASWENILEEATELARDTQILLLIGASLLGLLARDLPPDQLATEPRTLAAHATDRSGTRPDGVPLAVVHAATREDAERAAAALREAYAVGDPPAEEPPVVLEVLR